MAKKTDFMKVLGRTDYVVRQYTKFNPNATELITYLDFTDGGRYNHIIKDKKL